MLVTAFVRDFTAHPVGAAAFAGLIAYGLAERWQRWRQERDFQHQALLEFSEASAAVIACLWDLAQARANSKTVRYRNLLVAYPSKLQPLIARDAQFYAVFKKPLVDELDDFTQLMKRVHQKVCDPRLTVPLNPVSVVRPVIDCLTARRRLAIGHMALQMRLRPRGAIKALERELNEQALVPRMFA